jgi:hypothetical protein
MSWKEVVAALAVGALLLAGLFFVDESSPGWLRVAFAVFFTLLAAVATLAPALPFLVLVPWHFIALHRGLIRRSTVPCAVVISKDAIEVSRADELSSHALGDIVRARFARNGNWTESKMLDDALGLFASDGREIERLPGSTAGLDALVTELGARGIPVEDVDVSAPAFLD